MLTIEEVKEMFNNAFTDSQKVELTQLLILNEIRDLLKAKEDYDMATKTMVKSTPMCKNNIMTKNAMPKSTNTMKEVKNGVDKVTTTRKSK